MAQWANHQYRLHALGDDQRAFLPPALRCGTPEFHERAQQYKDAAIRNQFLLDCVLRHAGQPHSQDARKKRQPRKATKVPTNNNTDDCDRGAGAGAGAGDGNSASAATSSPPQYPSDSQMAKVSSALKSLVRDWSKEGQTEREQAYRPLLDLAQQYVPMPHRRHSEPAAASSSSLSRAAATAASSSSASSSSIRPPPRLCVPGAGVGRLALELAALGYEVQGNELSLHMLLASDFILNGGVATPKQPMRISPYLLETRNVHSATDTTRAIVIPDVDPYSLLVQEENGSSGGGGDGAPAPRPPPPEFSMAAGEFVSIYSAPREKEKWNGVVACFFLDNAPCVVEYLQVMYDMLLPGGVLLHFGPLLWHWSGPAYRPDDASVADYQDRYHHLDPKYMSSVDLCWEDVQAVLANIGFEVVESTTGQTANYTGDPRSMMCVEYKCLQFVARKPVKPSKDG
jgi:carnosine N-methyltransferase